MLVYLERIAWSPAARWNPRRSNEPLSRVRLIPSTERRLRCVQSSTYSVGSGLCTADPTLSTASCSILYIADNAISLCYRNIAPETSAAYMPRVESGRRWWVHAMGGDSGYPIVASALMREGDQPVYRLFPLEASLAFVQNSGFLSKSDLREICLHRMSERSSYYCRSRAMSVDFCRRGACMASGPCAISITSSI